MNTIGTKQRVAWLDIAKGIAILCTIVGHTVSYGSRARNLIFSFHMPLFFLLAGYTVRPACGKDLAAATWKDFKRLYIPVFVARGISLVLDTLFLGTDVTFGLVDNLRRILWGNGNDYTLAGGFSMFGVGVVWFLIALFWCKLGYRICLHKIRKNRPIFLLVFAFAGMWVGSIVRLPQCLDLVPVGMLFMEGGYQLRHKEQEYAASLKLAGIACFFVWIYMVWNQGIYIELATRVYPLSMLSVLLAFCGCLVVIQLSGALESFPGHSVLAWIGQHSLDLLCIHHIDYQWAIWNVSVFSPESSLAAYNPLISGCFRIVLDVCILFVWIWIKKRVALLLHPQTA